MEEFVKRMVQEDKELLERIGKLNSFTESEKFKSLSVTEKEGRIDQLRYMNAYHEALSHNLDLYTHEWYLGENFMVCSILGLKRLYGVHAKDFELELRKSGNMFASKEEAEAKGNEIKELLNNKKS